MSGAADIIARDAPLPRRMTPAALPASALLHLALFGALALLAVTQPLPVPPMRPIAVEVITEKAFGALFRRDAPAQAAPLPAPTPAPGGERLPREAPVAPQAAPAPQAITATQLLAGGILDDPANAGLRRALPTLSPAERATQLCNIEAVEQIRLAEAGSQPDTIAASAFADADLDGTILTAPGAAYRSARLWYAVSFECTVRPDLEAVTAFTLTLGEAIPPEQWEDHDLIAEDDEGDADGG